MKLAWITDPHFDVCSRADAWWAALPEYDAYLVTGDISNAKLLDYHLNMMSDRRKVYFVLGNHDYYHSSHAAVRKRMATRSNYLTLRDRAVALTDTTSLIGVDGWYDGRNGKYWAQRTWDLCDFSVVGEFIGLGARERLHQMRTFAADDANLVALQIHAAISRPSVKHLIIATHVPPWAGAAWHLGEVSDEEHQPFFSSRILGEAIEEDTRLWREAGGEVTVLCGHSHSEGIIYPGMNLTCRTGKAVYGSPSLYDVLELE